MKLTAPLLPFLALCLTFSSARADDELPFQQISEKRTAVRESYFEFPFLMAQTAVLVAKPAEEVSTAVRSFLSARKLPIPAHYSKQKAQNIDIQLPEETHAGNQLAAIEECSVKKCQVKLNTEREKKVMQASSTKVSTFKSLVSQRISAYLERRELLGYEERESNRDYFGKMLELFPSWKRAYPATAEFIEKGFWKNASAPANLVQTFLREELAIISPDRLQPIWRIGEIFEFEEKAARAFWEIHVYSNHYLDSSIRIIEVLPKEKSAILVISDIMEIDELTKSGFIRMLYKGKMGEAVIEAQRLDLKKILPP